MRATAEPVEGNLVRLSVEIDEPEVDAVLDDMVKNLARQARIPGFRPGKVPRRVLEARMGGAVALRAEALREALPDFYAQAVADAEVDPIAPPEIDITTGQESGPLAFDAVVQVRPTVAVPGYQGLRATVPAIEPSDEEVDRQVDRLRETDAELRSVGRPAIDRDHVTVNLSGSGPNGEDVVNAEDLLYEVGSATVVPELDEQLRGSKPGTVLDFTAAPPGGPDVHFRVLVKDVKEKILPELTDEWVTENSEFKTVGELRDDIRTRIGQVKVMQAQLALRENALAALRELVDDEEVPDILVEDEFRQRVHDLNHRLEEGKYSAEQLLAATGRSSEELLAEIRNEAFSAVKQDLALRAVADAQDLVVSDEDLDTEVAAMAARMDVTPEKLRAQLDHAGRTAAVRSERRKVLALKWLLDNVEVVDDEGNPVSRAALRVNQGAEGESSDDIADDDEESGGVSSDEADLAATTTSEEAMAVSKEVGE
jgi:trigger factor